MDSVCTPGTQSFVKLRQNNYFYIDKTRFIKDWWNSGVDVTLITRPRRFGKTLMLDTVKTFFSPEFAGRSELFEGLEIWKDEKFQRLQGNIPVIFLSFSDTKSNSYSKTKKLINARLARIYNSFSRVLDMNTLTDSEKKQFQSVDVSMDEATAQDSLLCLSEYLVHQNFSQPIILLDEYDSPLQEAWIHGYWDELIEFMRGFFNSTFKTNPYLERALITGITRVAKGSIFSDLNNLAVVTTTSDSYADCFGFTEEEVFRAMDRFGLTAKDVVKEWYDGFCFGKQKALYNPWSISNYLAKKEVDYYWADSSENALLGELLAHGDITIKEETAQLLRGESMTTPLDEQITFSQLYTKEGALWSLLLAVGYVKALAFDRLTRKYELSLTNRESQYIFENTISEWFFPVSNQKNKFIQALLTDDVDGMCSLI